MPDLDLRLLRSLKTIAQWCPVKPSEPKQLRFLLDPASSQLFGGAAGGGKSVALCMGALSGVHDPKWAALLLREELTSAELAGGIIDIMQQWSIEAGWEASGVKWDGQNSKWKWPNGAVIQFGYAKGGNHTRYLGSAWDFVGWDEAVLSSETALREVQSRLDRGRADMPARFRAATNPGTVAAQSHDYLYREFVDRAAEGRYLPSLLTDNPGIDHQRYLARLRDSLTAERYAALVHGTWEAEWVAGASWDPEDIHYVDPADVDGWGWVLMIDPSASGGPDADECGALLAMIDEAGMVIMEDLSRRERPAVWAERLAQVAREHNARVLIESNLAGSVDRLTEATDREPDEPIDVDLSPWGVVVERVPVRGAKQMRHVPVARLCRQGRIRFSESLRGGPLVRQMLTWVPSATGTRKKHGSPDRVDALSVGATVLDGSVVVSLRG